ncbi:uncharacterized protein LOC124359827 isoform X1 [Homalodisca vitripennis]|nr:uncharacterized protein LOC124359827 isoform X1 [Homalodisca vitripennis]XP_046668845.1 uncharacterized protein LOC124359827 isoform X1 [Homalodisca vitripennis]
MSDESDIQNNTGQRRKRPLNPASSSESSDSGNSLVTSKRSRKQLVVDSDNDSSNSENEEIIAVQQGFRNGTPKILSDYETGESNNEHGDLLTDSSESSSDEDIGSNTQSASRKTSLECLEIESSSDSDGQSEKCPICLAKFSDQEIGTPEACDHYFCAPCIQEWAKNVNTCPVDRQPFTLILVRQQLEGKVIRQIPVTVPTETIEIPEDATFCEVCGLSDREDRMLLCDACDHGYHMECLNPPLDHVPIDEWYCPECAPQRGTMRRSTGIDHSIHTEEQASERNESQSRDRPRPRMVPRTRHSERVRTTLRNRRVNSQLFGHQFFLQAITSSGVESMEGDGNPVRRRAKPRRNRVRKRLPGIRIKKIVTDDGVIEVKLKRKRRKKKRKNRTVRSAPRTVKGRLANKLGMCKPRMTNQMIPETLNRQELVSAPINHQRHQAGIPTLDIFGRRDQLDYFSGTDEEDGIESVDGGVGLLSRARVARPHDHFINRKKAATILSSNSIKKPLKLETLSSPSNGNLLDSILDSQTLWHSKKMEIKSKSDGSLQVILPKKTKTEICKETKIDVRNTVAPVVETPMFPGGRGNSGTYKPDNSSKGGTGNSQSASRSSSEQSFTESSSYQSSGSGGAGYSRYENNVGPAPLRGVAPIRFRMNIPPRRPNIHSYPTDNIPPPPPLRLRLPIVEMAFPSTNSPESSPTREEEEIDIYSDIEQEANVNEHETEEKSFGVLEPPPEPPFLMTMEPPPEPPAILMNINDDASDDEPSGLVIDDPPQGDVYDPCAVNSDDSSAEDTPLSKPPEVPVALKNSDLVADYSSNSCPNMETPSYNPELPTYLSTPIIGPLPRPSSHNSSEAEDSDEECPNFSMYSAASMNLAHRGLPVPVSNLDIPIPPSVEEDTIHNKRFDDIPLPEAESSKSDIKEDTLNIPIPQETNKEVLTEGSIKLTDIATNHSEDSKDSLNVQDETATEVTNDIQTDELEKKSVKSDDDEEDQDESGNEEDGVEADDQNADGESEGDHNMTEDSEKVLKSKVVKTKGSSEAGEDECSTQGDVLDLAIESEANLENNIPHDDSEEHNGIDLAKSPIELEENGEKVLDSGDKSDGLVDITDEEMSVYDGQDNANDLEKLNEQVLEEVQHRKSGSKSLYSDDDNSLVGGATSAVSAGTLNNSDNIQPATLPGLEGLETETISESEDVNFDELPMDGNEHHEILINDEDLISSKRKRKKKYRKISHTEDGKGNEPLEFEEGEIIEDKPKQVPKKDKKFKLTPDNEVKTDENVDTIKSKTTVVEKEPVEKKTKKKKEKSSTTKDKNEKSKEPKEKTLKPGEADENISWKKLSKSNKERNYRDGKEKDEKEKDRENKDEGLSKKEKRSKEKRKELERYNVRRLISEKPKRPKKDEFGRDISPSKSGSSLSPYRPPRYRSPLRTRNRSRTRSRSWKSRSRSRGRRRQSRSRDRIRSRDRSRRSRSRERSRKRSRSRNKATNRSRERRKTPDKFDKNDKPRTTHRSLSRTRRKSQSRSPHSRKHRSVSYSKSWTPSWTKSSVSRSLSRGRRKSRTISRTKSRSWTREQNVTSIRSARKKDPPKNLTVIVTNKDALKKKEKKKPSKKKDDRRKKKRGQSPAPSKEVFTSGDNILVSVNFKNANKNPELIPASTPLLRESSKRKRDDTDNSAKKKKPNSSKKSPGVSKSNRLAKINEVTRNAKPVAIIDLDLSPFREQTPSPKEVIVLSDSGDEGDKQHSEAQGEINRLGHSGITQSMLSLSSIDHGQKNSISQPESPLSASFLLNSSGPKTPPEPHIKFSISTKPSQIRILSNPLIETEEEMQDENIENDDDEILHKGPNTPPEPPPDLNTPASPPTTPYDPFDPTKSRSPSPQPRSSETGQQLNTSREDKLDNLQSDDNEHSRLVELRTSTPPNEPEDGKKTPEPPKIHSTPKTDPNNTDTSPKVSPPTGISEANKISEDTLMKPIQKLLAGANKLDVTVHKSPEKLITVVISQQVKNTNQTPKQTSQPLKTTPNKHLTPKSNAKHQLFSSSLLKQVPILGTLPLLPGPPVYTPSLTLNNSKMSGRVQQNGDPSDDMDIDPSSPYSPGSSEGDDLFEPPVATPPRSSSKPASKTKPSSGNKFDSLFGSSPAKPRHGRHTSKTTKKGVKPKSKGNKKEEVKVKLDEDQLKILDELPSSAVEMQVKDKFLKKLNRQERVVEEVKLVLKPHYAKKHINKEDYKEILRRAVPKICHNKSGEINPIKIQFLIEAYVKKFRYAKKKTSGAVSAPVPNKPKPQKTLWS